LALKIFAMLYTIGRFLQVLGLLILPVAIAGNIVNEQLSLKESLELSSVGILVFSVGWLMQQAVRKQ
jgi:hypothetical protein